VKHEKVIERVYNPWRVRKAWRQIKENAGAAGIDKMTVEDFEKREDELLELIHEKLKEGIYRFKPARRVLIPKEGTSKMRKIVAHSTSSLPLSKCCEKNRSNPNRFISSNPNHSPPNSRTFSTLTPSTSTSTHSGSLPPNSFP